MAVKRIGCYFAKQCTGLVRPGGPQPWFFPNGIVQIPYWRNMGPQEKLAWLVGRGRANVTPVWFADELPIHLPEGYRYWSEAADRWAQGGVVHRNPMEAHAHLFVFDILLRNWDDCRSNRIYVNEVPVAYDYGDVLNPNFEVLENFIAVAFASHGDHHSCIYEFARGYTPKFQALVRRAVEAFRLDDSELDHMAQKAGCNGDLRPLANMLKRTCRTLAFDVEQVLAQAAAYTHP